MIDNYDWILLNGGAKVVLQHRILLYGDITLLVVRWTSEQ